MTNDADQSLSTEPGGYRPSGGGRRPQRNRPTEGGRSVFLNAVMAVLVGGLVAAGWFIANQQQALIAEQARLTDANNRLQRLSKLVGNRYCAVSGW